MAARRCSRELGYGRVPATPAGGLHAADRAFPVSHLWERTPIHLLGWGVDLDRRTRGVPGAADRAPHAMVQELLNRSDDHLWALVSNGRLLRLLRDSHLACPGRPTSSSTWRRCSTASCSPTSSSCSCSPTSPASRSPRTGRRRSCWLERWRTTAIESGTRALGLLRDGVQAAIETLGTGFLQHPANGDLNRRLADRDLSLDDYHHALLRLVYRLLFLFVAEDRDALHHPHADPQARARYTDYYSTARLRRLALKRRGTSTPTCGRRCPWSSTPSAATAAYPNSACPASAACSTPDPPTSLTGLPLPNDALLAAVRHLSVVQPKGQPRRTVDYRNLGAEELGSIYESLLELVPRHDAVERTFTLETLAGNDRKTSGSYYTPTALIDLVLDKALDPLLDDAEKSARTLDDAEQALLAVTVCDPACGSGHFLVAAARRIAHRLAVARTGEVDPTPTDLQAALHDVIARCLYGVDINPLAAELAKVSLWLEALQPGRPLSFLDAHIKVGNALLGTTPALLAAGIPDEAYKALDGDDKKWVTALRRRNGAERAAAEAAAEQIDLFDHAGVDVSNTALRQRLRAATATPAASLADVHLAARRLRAVHNDPAVQRARAVADTWCAAFVAPKTDTGPVITHDTLTAVDDRHRPGRRHRRRGRPRRPVPVLPLAPGVPRHLRRPRPRRRHPHRLARRVHLHHRQPALGTGQARRNRSSSPAATPRSPPPPTPPPARSSSPRSPTPSPRCGPSGPTPDAPPKARATSCATAAATPSPAAATSTPTASSPKPCAPASPRTDAPGSSPPPAWPPTPPPHPSSPTP